MPVSNAEPLDLSSGLWSPASTLWHNVEPKSLHFTLLCLIVMNGRC